MARITSAERIAASTSEISGTSTTSAHLGITSMSRVPPLSFRPFPQTRPAGAKPRGARLPPAEGIWEPEKGRSAALFSSLVA